MILLKFIVERVYLCIALLPETTDHLLIYDFENLGRSRLVEDLKYFVDTLHLCKKTTTLHLSSVFSSLHVSQRGQPVQRRWYLTIAKYLTDAPLDQFKIYKPKKLRTGKAVEGSESSTGHVHVNKIEVDVINVRKKT